MVIQYLSFFQQADSEWIDPKEIDLNKYTSNTSKGCVLEVYLQYPKQLCKLNKD